MSKRSYFGRKVALFWFYLNWGKKSLGILLQMTVGRHWKALVVFC